MQPGTRLGVFEVVSPLGAGGMGEVFRARDTRLGRDVALKMLPPSLARDPSRLARLRTEARILASLSHPHIATLYGLEESDGITALVMELVPGQTLAQRLRRGPLPVREAIAVGHQIAAGLEAAHEKGVLHRDLKPSNVALDTKGQAKLLDFGLARPATGGAAESHVPTATSPGSVAGAVVGTAPYMSPEQARGQTLDKRTDVWAFGCVLFEMLAGRRAFPGATWAETAAAILEKEPDWTALPQATPANVRRLLERCLEKERERRLRDLGDARLELDERGRLQPRPDDETPYPGLAPFTEAGAADFHGREAEADALWAKLRERPLLAVIGPSGAGKTSFVHAGVVAGRPDGWAAIVCAPGASPMLALGQALAPELAGDREALQALVRFDDTAALSSFARWRNRHSGALLVVDQFEELFTLNAPDVRARFAELLGRLAGEAGVRVLLSLRDDFLMRCGEHPALAPVFADLTPLGPPSAAGLRRALVEPAARRGYRFEDDTLVDEMLATVEGIRGALPLLSFAMARLWEKRDARSRLLTRSAYEELGGVIGALARHGEATLGRIGGDRHGMVREMFRNLVTAQGTRAVIGRDELLSVFGHRGQAEKVLDALIAARLLTAYETSGEEGAPRQLVEVVHEALLSAWPRLVRWRAQDTEGALLRDQLRQASHAWQERGRPQELLWTGTPYREFVVWRERYPGGLSATEEAFAAAMSTLAQRSRRRRQIAVAGVIAGLVVGIAIVGALWRRSEDSRRRAEGETLRAEAAKLLALGRLELDAYPTAAVAYTTKSLELADSGEARRFAVEALSRGPGALILPLAHGRHLAGPVREMFAMHLAFSPNGKWLATSSLGPEVLVWPSSGGAPLVLGGHEIKGGPIELEFGPDSEVLVTLTGRGPLRIWSIPERRLIRKTSDFAHATQNTAFFWRTGRLVTTTPTHDGQGRWLREWPVGDGPAHDLGVVAIGPAFDTDVDPDLEWLAVANGRDLVIHPLAVGSGKRKRPVGRHLETITWIAYGPRGRLLSLDRLGEIRIWSIEPDPPVLVRSFRGPPGTGQSFFDETGTRVATVDQKQRAIRVHDVTGPPQAEPLTLRRGDATQIRSIAFGRGVGKQWLAGSTDTSITLWPLPEVGPRVLLGHNERVNRLRFAPDGSWIVSSADDSTVRVWPLADGGANAPRVLFDDPTRVVWGLAVDPSGARVLAGSSGPGAFLVSPRGEAGTVRLEPPVTAPRAVAFDHQGRRAAIGAAYGLTTKQRVIRVWDLQRGGTTDLALHDGKPQAEVATGYEGGVTDLEFAPDGALYSGGSGGVRRWDVGRGTSETLVEGPWVFMDLSRDGRRLLTATGESQTPMRGTVPCVADVHDLDGRTTRRLATHGTRVLAIALDPTGEIAVTAGADGIVRVGRVTGEEPHLLFGHSAAVTTVAVSADGKWIGSGGQDGSIRLWPMPDFSKPPLHTLGRDVLLARLRSLTNLHVVQDPSAGGYALDVGPFPGWEKPPDW
jgi:WD40 repeat protein